MIRFFVNTPEKSKNSYYFTYYSKVGKNRRFGFHIEEDIPHGSVWDTLYPLMFITRNGGPVFNKRDEVEISFKYPVVSAVVDVMVERCRLQGVQLEVTAPSEIEATAEPPLWDCVVSFGGGKESSLNCGVARELGYSPIMLMGTPEPSVPAKRWTWPDMRFFTPCNKGVSDRLIVQLMCGATVYHGSCLDDSMRSEPWHQYYDIGSQEGWSQINSMFERLGIERKVITPLECLPCAQVPRILCSRYPDVASKRRSVDNYSGSEKKMHVSLCEMTGSISPLDHCSPGALATLVKGFVKKYVAEDYGKRDARLLARDGMCAMLYHLRDHEYLSPVRGLIRDEWERRFIHLGHFYKNVPKQFEEIFRKYLEESPDGSGLEGGVWME